MRLENGAQISATTRGQGNAGALTVRSKRIELIGSNSVDNLNFTSGLFSDALAEGDAGALIINTDLLFLENGAQISASTFGSGNGNNLIINAKDIQIIGRDVNDFRSGLFVDATTGNGGELRIDTDLLLLENGARISASTFSEGNAGELRIDTDLLLLDNGAQISASTFSEGNAGNLTIKANNIELIGTDPVSGSASGLFASAIDAFSNNADGNGGNRIDRNRSLKD